MPDGTALAARKFLDPDVTADGAPRAAVAFERLETLWVNTGTLCNIECAHCYIESSPANDRFAYLTRADLAPFLAEAKSLGARSIGFTGGEPFMNPAMADMARDALEAGFDILILTNAMKPMMRPRVRAALSALRRDFDARLAIRVSLDHYTEARHDAERGGGGFRRTLEGLSWLAGEGFSLSVAGRTLWGETESAARAGYVALFRERAVAIDADDPSRLVLFPEMDEFADTPEISTACWSILGKSPSSIMCATSRMVVKRKGEAPAVLACTLIPYDRAFELGASLAEARAPVRLNHPHCSKFCVLGGASCAG